MSIIRVRKDARYFSASNEPFNDVRLSWDTRGIMGYLLSKPDQWEIHVADLIKKGPAGEHKVRRMLAEARLYGYMNRIRITQPDKTFEWLTEVFESPSLNPNPSKDIIKVSSLRFSTSGSSTRGSSTRGSSTRGKPPSILSTEGLSTELEREVFAALEKLTGGLNTDTPRFVDTWKEKHTYERIIEAIALAKTNGARSVKYVDEILVTWEANGYPKTREERVNEKRANGNGSKPAETPDELIDRVLGVTR